MGGTEVGALVILLRTVTGMSKSRHHLSQVTANLNVLCLLRLLLLQRLALFLPPGSLCG